MPIAAVEMDGSAVMTAASMVIVLFVLIIVLPTDAPLVHIVSMVSVYAKVDGSVTNKFLVEQ